MRISEKHREVRHFGFDRIYSPLLPGKPFLKFDAQATFDIFSLHFEALPQQDLIFDMIEYLHGDHTDFNYFGIEISLKDGVEAFG